MPVTVTRRSALRPPPPAVSVLALFYSVDFRLAFPFLLTSMSVKNILLAELQFTIVNTIGGLGYAFASRRRVELLLYVNVKSRRSRRSRLSVFNRREYNANRIGYILYNIFLFDSDYISNSLDRLDQPVKRGIPPFQNSHFTPFHSLTNDYSAHVRK